MKLKEKNKRKEPQKIIKEYNQNKIHYKGAF